MIYEEFLHLSLDILNSIELRKEKNYILNVFIILLNLLWNIFLIIWKYVNMKRKLIYYEIYTINNTNIYLK